MFLSPSIVRFKRRLLASLSKTHSGDVRVLWYTTIGQIHPLSARCYQIGIQSNVISKYRPSQELIPSFSLIGSIWVNRAGNVV